MSRLVLGVLTLVLAGALAVTAVVAGPEVARTLGLVAAGAGLTFLALAVRRYPTALAPGLALVALPWGLTLARSARPVAAVLVGAWLLLVGEVGGWAVDRRTVVPEHAGDAGRMVLRTAGLVGAGAAASVLLLAVSALPAPGSLVRLLAGLGAASAVVAFVVLRRWER